MKSMTGFGRGESSDPSLGISFTVELSSVNRKQFELRCGMPREISSYEPLLREKVSAKISRGFISAKVNMEMGDAALEKAVNVNELLAAGILEKCRNMQQKLQLPGDLTISDIINFPGVVESTPPDMNTDELEDLFAEAAEKAVNSLVQMRMDEGLNLKKDLSERISTLRKIVEELKPEITVIPELQTEKLMKRLEDAGLPLDLDDERILREIVVFSDKSDVSEEITRLFSHFDQFENFIENDSAPIGRSMDFLIQEINREITTLGNKAAGSKISNLAVQFKTELEKIREQVQNVE